MCTQLTVLRSRELSDIAVGITIRGGTAANDRTPFLPYDRRIQLSIQLRRLESDEVRWPIFRFEMRRSSSGRVSMQPSELKR
jgi:hypothetical protein